MPGTPVEPTSRGPYDPTPEQRVSGLEEDMREVGGIGSRFEASVADCRQTVTRIAATPTVTLPHLATKAQRKAKPGKAYLAGLLAMPITADAAGPAARVILE